MVSFSASRLKSKKIIGSLFESGKSSFAYPVKMIYIKTPVIQEEKAAFHFAVSVSKKKFKRAVDRNRIKRQMRAALQEVLRNSHFVLDIHIDIMFIYVGRELPSYSIILKAIHKQMLQLTKQNP